MDGFTNEQILEEHFSRPKGSILVSPSMGFGIDLHGEYGEFQIIMKLPYAPLGSKRIKALLDRDPNWYQMKMLISLVQMCGRIIRSKDDIGETYILDGQTVDILKNNWDRLPKWFKARLK
jgi:Rad3-related DNA helicase